MQRDDAYRIVQAPRSAPGTRARRCASCSPPSRRAAGLDLDALFDYGALRAPRRTRSSRGSTRVAWPRADGRRC